MSGAIPPLPPGPGGHPAAMQPGERALATVALSQLPDRLMMLARAIAVGGTVVAASESGTVVLRSQFGEIVLTTPVALPIGRVVTLQIPAGNPPASALLFANPADSHAPPPGAAGTQSAAGQPPPTAATPPSAPPTTAAVVPVPLPDLQPGDLVAARLLAAVPPLAAEPTQVGDAAAVLTLPQPGVTASTTPPPAPAVGGTSVEAAPISLPTEVQAALRSAGEVALQMLRLPGLAQALSALNDAPSQIAQPTASASFAPPPSPAADMPSPAMTAPLPEGAPLPAAVPAALAMATAMAMEASVDTPPQPPVMPAGTPLPAAAGAQSALPAAPGTTPLASVAVPAPAAAEASSGGGIVLATATAAAMPAAPDTAAAIPSPLATALAGAIVEDAALAASAAVALRQYASRRVASGEQAVADDADLHVRLLDPTAEDGPQPAAAATLPARVLGTSVEGRTILETPLGPIALAGRLPTPPGAELTLVLPELPDAPAAAAGVPKDTDELARTLTRLAETHPALAHTIAANLMPQPGPRLVTQIAAFIEAAKAGGLPHWVGRDGATALTRLEPGGNARGLADLLGNAIQPRVAMTDARTWWSITVPFAANGVIVPLTIRVRHQEDEDGGSASRAAAGARTTRFQIDLELTRLGPLQLDGLSRPRRLDIVLRSRQSLELRMRQELSALYADTVSAMGLTGSLQFQTGMHGWIVPAGGHGGLTA